jgi:hypothetical protein
MLPLLEPSSTMLSVDAGAPGGFQFPPSLASPEPVHFFSAAETVIAAEQNTATGTTPIHACLRAVMHTPHILYYPIHS